MKVSQSQCYVLAQGSLQAFSSAVSCHSPFSLTGHGQRGRLCSESLLSRRKPFLQGSTRIRSVHGPTKPLQRAERKAQPTQAISGWPDTALEKAIDALQHMHSLARIALRWTQSQSYHLEKWYVKAAASVLLVLGIITVAANVWCLGPINQQYIPQAVRQAEIALERKVGLGRVRWVAPSGLVGFGPLASVGPVSLGPGAAEKSSLELPSMVVCVDPLQSLLQGKLIVQLHADQAQVSLVQADNFAWFGYPDDPEPSARNFLPGLGQGVEADVAQRLLPSGEGGQGSGQHLGGLAARLSSKVARAEARQGMAPAPESAFNFRPAVGLELKLVSKDERELTQSRAELEALLTQQRSAQAARVQSLPSTSTQQAIPQETGVALKRQPSKHRGSPAAEQAQHAKRERGHVSQPKASALRLQSSRPPFASISAGQPSNRPTGNAETPVPASEASRGLGQEVAAETGAGTQSQGDEATQQHEGARQGHDKPMNDDSKARGVQRILPSLHGVSYRGQKAAPPAALQPLSADKSLGAQEEQHELAERLGLIRPGDSFARALGPRHIRHSAKEASNGAPAVSAAAGVSDEAGRDSAHTVSNQRKQGKPPQVLEITGAEAQSDATAEAPSQAPGRVSWCGPPAGGARALHVSMDGPKDAMRQSQGLKTLLGDEARAREAEPAQQETAIEPEIAELHGHTEEPAGTPAAAHGSNGMQGADAATAELLDRREGNGAAGAAETSNGHSSEQAPGEPLPNGDNAESREGLLDSFISRLHAAKGSGRRAWSSRSQDAHWYSGPEGNAAEHGEARGAHSWRPRASARRTVRSALREGRPTAQQELDKHSWSGKEEEARADAPAETAVTGIEDVQADVQADSVEEAAPTEGAGTDARSDTPSQAADVGEKPSESVATSTEEAANTSASLDPVDRGAPGDSHDKKPAWRMQLRQQLHDRAAGLRANAEGLFGGLWQGHGWKQSPEAAQQLPTASAKLHLEQPAPAEAAEVGSASADRDLAIPSRAVKDAGLRFSLHRSHRQLLVSTAETAAVSCGLDASVHEALAASAQQRRPRRKIRFATIAVLPEHGLREQLHPAAAPRPPPQQQRSEVQTMAESAGADMAEAEVPTTEEEEVAQQPGPSQQQPSIVSTAEAGFSTIQGTALSDSVPEAVPGPAQEPASFELMAVPGPSILGSARDVLIEAPHPSQAAEAHEEAEEAHAKAAAQETEAAAAGSKLQEVVSEAAAPEESPEEPAESTAAKEEDEQAAIRQADEQARAHIEQEAASAHPPAEPDMVPKIQEAIPGEVEVVAPVLAAEPKAEPSALPEAGRGKAKHSWHSPALSARYGELPYDEPRYKPRIPDADQGGLRAWAAKHISAALAQARPPQLALERVVIRNGDLWATLTGEAVPRHVQNVDLKLRLGRDYRTLTLDISGLAHERDAASDKCTMMNSITQRHLRDAPSAPIVRSFSEVPDVAGTQRSNPQQQPEGIRHIFLGGDRFEWEQQLQCFAKEASEASPGNPGAPSSSLYGDSGDLDDPIKVTMAEQQKGGWFGRAKKGQPKPARPTGGRVRVRVNVKEMGVRDRLADLEVIIWGENLHAPLIERVVELPIDIYGGRLNGKLRLVSNDADSWRFPIIKGRIRGHDLGFHFFDAPDDFSKTKLDLLFEGDRLYLHGAQGYFGAVPLTLTGDMDLNPETGQYRLSANVPSVEANDLRRTLAIRPLPFPVCGGVRGVLHVTGPLETPVFSGTAVAMPPRAEEVEAMEDSSAKETLREFSRAAGAYDRMPFASATAVWTLDTSTDIFLLHSFQAEPLAGGQLLGSGRMWVSPIGEVDPRAVKVRFEGRNLPTETLLKRYLPKRAPLPPMEVGDTSVAGTMEGSFLAPDMHMSWEAPAAAASGSVDLSRDANSFTCRAPALDVSAALLLKPAPIDALKTVLTQAEATALAQPQIEGADIDCNFKGLDVLPLANALERSATAKTQRLKLNGHTKVSVRLTPMPGASEAAGKTEKQASERPSAFSGELTLDGLRVNQLKLSRNLTGSILLSDEQFQIRAKGMKPDEVLEVSLKLPFAPGSPSDKAKEANVPTGRQGTSGQSQGTGAALLGKQRPGLGGLGTLLPRPRFAGPASPLLAPQNPVLSGLDPQSGASGSDGGHFVLRCGNLLMSAEVNGRVSAVECAVQGLLLDELELASLRGEVQEAALSLNLEQRLGRAVVSIAGPRFSGLQGQSLSGAFRWERDVVRLERAVLQQANSRYEVQGEYVIPSIAVIPKSAADMALMQGAVGQAGQGARPGPTSTYEQANGRWRVQVSVPTANMEEIIPAARLLSRATALTHSDYERAKAAFLSGMDASGLAAQEIGQQLEAAALAMRMAMEADANTGMEDVASSGNITQHATGNAGEKERKQSSQRTSLPGLQDLKGQWSGGVQAYGGGGGATNVDFNVRGQSWQWGDYALDQVVASGSCHSIEGIKLEELGLKTGEAKLLVRGTLLGAAQDASIILTDFPVAILQPLFRALPALEHAAPAASVSGGPGGSSGGGTLGGLAVPFVRGAHLRSHAARPYTFSNSPVNGLLYVRGTIGGSAAVPEGEVVVRLYDGAVGPTYLAQAQASASLNAAQQLAFSADLAPAEAGRHSGHVRVSGSIPLRPPLLAPAGTLLVEGTAGMEDEAGLNTSEQLEVDVSVKDGGMMLVTALTPDLRWQSGAAELALSMRGVKSQPQVEGRAHFSKAAMLCPWLKYPITNLGGSVRLADNALMIEGLEAHVGRRGRIRIKGGLPLTADAGPASADTALLLPAASGAQEAEGKPKEPSRAALLVDVHGLEMRVRNVYTGYLDAGLKLHNSLTAPSIGGDVRISHGVASLMPGGPSAPSGGGGSGSGSAQPGGGDLGEMRARARESDLVLKAFTVLTRKDALARQLSRLDVQQAGEASLQPMAQALCLNGLKIHLGPELRAMFPVVLNMGISGDIELNGAASPESLKVAGTIYLAGGEVNLVATQLVLDREHPNRLVFSPSRGLDPLLDLRLRGAQVQALIQGRASAWQQNLVLTPTKGGAGDPRGATEAAEAARIFEGQLAGALVAEDGQLALSNLAASAAHGFMPKIQTQGQLGQARWRLVSAPSIPGLLSLDPSGDPTSLLSSLTMGTEVEVQFGRSLQAAMARKLRDSDIATQWTLNYQLNSKLRMQFNIASSSPYPRTLVFQYSSETTPPPLPR